jgi:diacylglycerol kinase family enzyme
VQWDFVETRAEQFAFGELTDRARSAAFAVAVGGDGTVTDVLTGLGSLQTPLAIVAGGSTNVIAQELGLPIDASAIGKMLFGPHDIRTLDAATCNQRMFLHMAGAGFDSRIFDHTNPELKRRVGWFAYLPSAASSIRLPPSRFTVRTEAAEFELTSPMVLVANGAGVIRPSLYVYPGISSSDGWLDLIAITASNPTAIAGVVARFASRTMDRSPHIIHARCKRVSIKSNPPMPIQVDGDVIGATDVEIEVLPGRARMIVPAGTGDGPAREA